MGAAGKGILNSIPASSFAISNCHFSITPALQCSHSLTHQTDKSVSLYRNLPPGAFLHGSAYHVSFSPNTLCFFLLADFKTPLNDAI